MRLLDETIDIEMGGIVAHLRPSLRAAARIERRHGDISAIFKMLAEGNVSAMRDLVREGDANSDLLDEMQHGSRFSPRDYIIALHEPLARFAMLLTGRDIEEEVRGAPSSEPMSQAEFNAKLFEIATGALGWTPEVAWNASPREILHARRGRDEFMGPIYVGLGLKSNDEPEEVTFDELKYML